MPANRYTRGLRGPIFWLLLATAVAVLAPTAHMLLDGGPAGVLFWLILAVLMVSLLLMRVRLTGPTVRINAGAATFLVSAENPEEVVADIERRRVALHG